MSSPLVLVVEDDPDALAIRVLQLESAGCRAIAVDNSDDAIRELWHSPLIGGLLTDINLVSAGDDKSGVALAKYVKEHRPSLPIAGYSGVFAEDRLSPEELDLFDAYYGAGKLTADDIRTAIAEVAEMAQAFERIRRDEADARLDKVREQFQVGRTDFDTFRRLIPDEDLAIEQVLAGASLHAHIIGPGRLPTAGPGGADGETDGAPALAIRTPVVIWVREEDDGAEAEVHGVPELYAFGESTSEAIANVMDLAADHFGELHDATDLGGPLASLQRFVVGVFDHDSPPA